MNKREFVMSACTGVAAGVAQAGTSNASNAFAAQGAPVPAAVPNPARPGQRPDLLANPSLATWQRYAGDRFDCAKTGPQLLLRAVEEQHAQQAGEQFTLLFEAAAGDQPWAGGTTTITHPATAQKLPMYLQDAGHNAAGKRLWRAEFNRLA